MAAMGGAPTAGSFARIRAVVRSIPRGRVMTYGEVARAAGFSRGARLAGRALHAAQGLPWHRVVAQARPGRGRIALRDPAGADLQRDLLRRERVRFEHDGTIDLCVFGVARDPPSPPLSCSRGGRARRRPGRRASG